MDVAQTLLLTVYTGLLAAARTSALLMPPVSPLGFVPVSVRLGMMLVYAIAATQLSKAVTLPADWSALAVGLLVELGIGLVLVVPLHIGLGMLQTGGRLIDMQIGFGASGVLDPNSHAFEALTGTALTMVATLLLFATDAHHDLLRLLTISLAVIPLGGPGAVPTPAWFAGVVTSQTLLGFLVVLPVCVALFATDVAVTIASRSMPQVNAYFVSLPLKLGIGLAMLAATVRHSGAGLIRLLDNATALAASAFARG